MGNRSLVRRPLLAAVALFAVTAVAPVSSFAQFTCSQTPLTGCLQPTPPHPSGLWMNVRHHRRDNVVWKWYRGRSAQGTSFADPTTTNDYAFCLYTEDGASSTLIFHGVAPAGGNECKGRSCWRATGTGYRYRTGQALPDGVTKLYLDARPEGRARIVLKGRGEHLILPDLPVNLPLRVQLQSENGQCWEGEYVPSTVTQNSEQRFRGHAE